MRVLLVISVVCITVLGCENGEGATSTNKQGDGPPYREVCEMFARDVTYKMASCLDDIGDPFTEEELDAGLDYMQDECYWCSDEKSSGFSLGEYQECIAQLEFLSDAECLEYHYPDACANVDLVIANGC